jgi:hypothetical protein
MGYYSGDPGFFSIVKSLGSAALGMIPGGGAARTVARAAGGLLAGGRGVVKSVGGGIIKHPVMSAAGAAGALAIGAGTAGRAGMFGRAAGKHPSARHLRALAMGLKRARPRMNVTNVHALRRSLRRAHGFARLAMKTIHLVHPRKKARFGGFKKKRGR